MGKVVAFFGHRDIFDEGAVAKRLMQTIKHLVSKGYTDFLIGRHGDFDNIVLECALNLKKKLNEQIKIILVLTSLSCLKKDEFGKNGLERYILDGCETMMYDIEEEHFKNRIISSNRRMVDDSHLIICYVNMKETISGSKRAINYAIKQGKKIINLYKEKDNPFYDMTQKEIDEKLKEMTNFLEKIKTR